MSMNLIYKHLDENGEYITSSDFPFQTPTELTKRVLATKDTHLQMMIILNQLIDWGWENDRVDEIMSSIEATLARPRIELGMI